LRRVLGLLPRRAGHSRLAEYLEPRPRVPEGPGGQLDLVPLQRCLDCGQVTHLVFISTFSPREISRRPACTPGRARPARARPGTPPTSRSASARPEANPLHACSCL